MRYFRLSAKFKKNEYFYEKKQKKKRKDYRTKQKLGAYEAVQPKNIYHGIIAKKEAKKNQKQ
jgi:hypothetical protein